MGYLQTWQWVCRFPKPIKKIIQCLCGIKGHHWSKTEKGYSGCGMVDLWCRWCNFHTSVLISEIPSAEYLRDIFNNAKENSDETN